MVNTFTKAERLCRSKDIVLLRRKGHRVSEEPLMVTFLPFEQTQVLVYVPKRLFKHAVDRNLLKRRIREAYRCNKRLLEGDKHFFISLQYNVPEKVSFQVIERGVIKTLQYLNTYDETTT